jgi:ribulose 1,5-bisphosphate synthetase/thiazole synthase
MNVRFDRSDLPILHDCDIVVSGGSFGGVAAALVLARGGKRVLLLEPRTYLGREATATLRPWFELSGDDHLPDLIEACLEMCGRRDGSSVPFRMDAIKILLEDLLVAAGVELLYASLPVALCLGEDGLEGVVIGNKSGRQVVRCKAIVDASETALVMRLGGADFEPPRGSGYVSRTLEFDRVEGLSEGVLRVPSELNLVEDQVRVRQGYRGSSHVLIDCGMVLPLPGTTAIELAQREAAARQVTMEVASQLMTFVPAFRRAYLAGASLEVAGPYSTSMTGEAGWLHPSFEDVKLAMPSQPRAAAFAGPLPGLWCLSEAARTDVDTREPVGSSALGEALAQVLLAHWEEAHPTFAGFAPTEAPPSASGLTVVEFAQPRRGRAYERYAVGSSNVPVLRDVDVLVVGGGTSGATAAVTAAREGMRTVLVEMNSGLGGAGTYGGVNDYWFGRRVGFAARLTACVAEVHRSLQHPVPAGEMPHWNIEAKAHVLLSSAVDAEVDVLLDSFVIGTVVEGRSVRGVVAATRFGPVALLARVTVDASGDGDVAAHAAAEYVYGSAREHVTMWYSLAQFGSPGRTANNFTSTVNVGDVEDYTRAILAGRRRTRKDQDELHDHGVYLAPRESRHIEGDVVLTLTDQLLKRRWVDTVNIAFSNNDIKGPTTSDWLRIGLISPNLEIEIPYRALLPRSLENIIIVGKAISATHDALPAIRMQADLENLGGVGALAAAMAVEHGTTPRAIDVDALQRRLVEVGVLPPSLLGRTLVRWQPSDEELRALIAEIRADRPLYAYSDMRLNEVFEERIPLVDVCCAGPQAVPLLEEACAAAEGPRKLLLAQVLCMVGSATGVPVVVQAVLSQLGGGLPPRASIRHSQPSPDQGAMPDVVYLVHSLGMARDERALPVWEHLVALLAEATREALRDKDSGIFDYVDAVCVGAERLGSREAVPLLERLHGYAPFSKQHVTAGFQPDYFEERQAYLELIIGRALARCGSKEGIGILIDYLDDARAMLAEHAHSELVAITGHDFGKDVRAWQTWSEGREFEPMPWLERTDPVANWGHDVLVPASTS